MCAPIRTTDLLRKASLHDGDVLGKLSDHVLNLTSPSANASATAPASFALSATAASTTSSIAKVDFYSGTTLIGTATTGTAGLYNFTWNNVAAGTYSLTAKATDTKNAVTTSTVIPVSVVNANVPPTVSLTSPAPNTTVIAPATFTLVANAADSDGSISKVEFFNGTTLLGTTTVAPYSYIWNNVAAGNYNLTALATDNTGANTTSSAINVTVNPGEAQVYYIHTDHLDTPREITDTNGNVVWQWDNTDPFGDNPPNENPSGLGQFEFNLRFPGQNYDKETGLHYNYFRDYDPSTGRYIQSDPIGLAGGFNTYTYVNGNPVSNIDPVGLWTWAGPTDIYNYWREFVGGTSDFVQAYGNQFSATNIVGGAHNGWANQDKYFHCRANCEAAQRGPGGEDAAQCMSDSREVADQLTGDPPSASAADQVANQMGRVGGSANPGGSCQQICGALRPSGSFPANW